MKKRVSGKERNGEKLRLSPHRLSILTYHSHYVKHKYCEFFIYLYCSDILLKLYSQKRSR
jgi:hypothetical protein